MSDVIPSKASIGAEFLPTGCSHLGNQTDNFEQIMRWNLKDNISSNQRIIRSTINSLDNDFRFFNGALGQN